MGHSRTGWLWIGLALLSSAWAAEPWTLHPVQVDQPVVIETAVDQLRIDTLTLRHSTAGPTAELACTGEGFAGQVGVMVVAYDADRQPLAAGYEKVALPKLSGRRSSLASSFRLTIGFGPLPEREEIASLAVGPLTARPARDNLLALSAGARAVDQSSCYGGSYTLDRVLDGNPLSQWATETGKISDQWLVVELAGGKVHTVSGIGINPWGEPGATDCALHHFTLQASTTGAAPEDFTTVLEGACAYANELQAFTFQPVEARYLKLVCHDNHGNSQWIELTSFEAYPVDTTHQPRPELAAVLGGFDTPPTAVSNSSAPNAPNLNLDLAELNVFFYQPVGPPTVAVESVAIERIGCKESRSEWQHETATDHDLDYLQVTHGFGMLLGGARQLCAAVVGDRPMGQPARLQFDADVDPPTNRLRVVVWDSHDAWFEFGLEGAGRGWQRHWVDLDPQAISKRGGPNAPVFPLTKLAIGVAPKGRDGLDGSFKLDDPILLYPAP